MTSLANALEPSRRAAAAPARSTARPRSASASASPATSGASGPTTTRSTASSRAAAQRVDVVGAASSSVRVGRDPGVAGRAQHLGRAAASARSARTSACSRPPAPTTRTLDATYSDGDEVVDRDRGERLVLRRAARAELERDARHRRLVGRLDDVDEVEVAERRPLRLDARAELLDLLVDLPDALRVVLDRLDALGREGREHDVGGHRRLPVGRVAPRCSTRSAGGPSPERMRRAASLGRRARSAGGPGAGAATLRVDRRLLTCQAAARRRPASRSRVAGEGCAPELGRLAHDRRRPDRRGGRDDAAGERSAVAFSAPRSSRRPVQGDPARSRPARRNQATRVALERVLAADFLPATTQRRHSAGALPVYGFGPLLTAFKSHGPDGLHARVPARRPPARDVQRRPAPAASCGDLRTRRRKILPFEPKHGDLDLPVHDEPGATSAKSRHRSSVGFRVQTDVFRPG